MSRDVGVGQLVEELEQRGDRLPFEIGAFVALEACEGLLQQTVKLEPDDVRVTIEGAVVVSDSARPAAPEEASRSLMSVLARLLVAAGPGVPPHLLQLVKEGTQGDAPRGLRDLHDAIEASLIPINRGASRRVLARLVRESDRPSALDLAQVDSHALDAELDELLRDPVSRSFEVAPAPPSGGIATLEEDEAVTERIRVPNAIRGAADPDVGEASTHGDRGSGAGERSDAGAETGAAHEPSSRPKSFPPPLPHAAQAAAARKPMEMPEPITATIRKWIPEEEPTSEPTPPFTPAPATETAPASAPAPVSAPVSASASVSASPSAESPIPSRDRPSLAESPPTRRGGWGIFLIAGVLGLGVYALIASGRLEAWLEPTASAPAVEAPPAGAIDLTVTPADAQIFVFVGRGPATAERLSVEKAHEFVVFDRGLRPARASVPRQASWDTTRGAPLYELAVQTAPIEATTDAIDLGAPETEPSDGTATGNLGAVRVITNPPGAKVYRFVGLGPTARIAVTSIHEGQELLVYHPGYETRRAVIGPSDWQPSENGLHRATLTVQLPAVVESPTANPVEN